MPSLIEALSLVALLAATLEYAVLIHHREERRAAVRWQAELRESLVSSGRAEAGTLRRWTDDGTRFRLVR